MVFRPENEVGKILKPYGGQEQGELLVHVYGNMSAGEPLREGSTLYVEIDSLAVPLFVREFRPMGASRAIVLFDDFERLSEAQLLVGLKLFTRSAAAEPADTENTTADHEYIGFRLVDAASGLSGRVVAYYDYPENPVVGVVFDTEAEVLIPLGLATSIDRRKKLITATLPDGLLEL